MRSVVIIGVMVCLLAGAFAGSANAVGYYVVGKEDCRCSSLVQRGVVPDTVNKLQEAFVFPRVADWLESIGMDMRGFFAQFGEAPPVHVAEAAPAKEEPSVAKEKPAAEKKPEAEVKKEEVKKEHKARAEVKSKKHKAKKRVKVPSRAM
jgi:hypothetical protein